MIRTGWEIMSCTDVLSVQNFLLPNLFFTEENSKDIFQVLGSLGQLGDIWRQETGRKKPAQKRFSECKFWALPTWPAFFLLWKFVQAFRSGMISLGSGWVDFYAPTEGVGILIGFFAAPRPSWKNLMLHDKSCKLYRRPKRSEKQSRCLLPKSRAAKCKPNLFWDLQSAHFFFDFFLGLKFQCVNMGTISNITWFGLWMIFWCI